MDSYGKTVSVRRFRVACRCGRIKIRHMSSLRRKELPTYCSACLPRTKLGFALRSAR